MRLLELFAGTGSIGKAFRLEGWEVTGLDINLGHVIQCDIMEWKYREMPRDSFDAIWASPPCTQYSIARTTGPPRDLEGADALVQKTLDIIAFFDVKVFMIENPQTGMMKGRPVMAGMTPYLRTVSYCKYGMDYRKHTAIWSNLYEHWVHQPPCCKATPCDYIVDGNHLKTAQRGSCKAKGVLRKNDSYGVEALYRVPHSLCVELARATTTAVRARTLESTDE